jgi:hypothetical protein
MRDSYSHNQPFQGRLLALLIRRPGKALTRVKADYFTSPAHREIAKIVEDVHRQYPSDRLSRTTLLAMIETQLGRKQSNLAKLCRREVKSAYKVEFTDESVLLREAAEFATHVRLRDALIETGKLLNQRKYDAACKLMRDAARVDHSQNTGVSLPVYPVHRLMYGEEDPEAPSDNLIYPIVPRGGATMLFGLPKELKSWFGAALAIDAACGRNALGFFAVEHPIRVLYVQVEDTHALTRDRIKELARNQGRKNPFGMLKVITRCPLNLMDPAWRAALEQEIEKFRPELIILDVLRRLFRGNVADAKETAEFQQVLDSIRDRYGCAILLIHHAKKGETSTMQANALGSINLTAWPDVLIYITGKRRLGTASIAEVRIESKAATLDEDKLTIMVDSENYPMVRVGREGDLEMEYLVSVVSEHPGMNQKQLEQLSHVPEKKLRELLKQAVEDGLLRSEPGNRKELLYYPVEKKKASEAA